MQQQTSGPPDSYRKPVRVAIQGVAGAFHDIAARHFFGPELAPAPALSFDTLADMTVAGESVDAAVMAIENTIAGSILPNYNLLLTRPLHIAGELMLRIRQNLLVVPGTKISELEEVHSHPVALAQCKEFFVRFPHIRLVESDDTAAAAAWVAAHGDRRKGAIASGLAGELHRLEVLAANIETFQANYTRFLLLHRGDWQVTPSADKVSICLTLPHQPGSLHLVLHLLTEQGANLTKIQSAPLPEHPWEYRFFIDFIIGQPERLTECIEQLQSLLLNYKILGVYPAGRTFE